MKTFLSLLTIILLSIDGQAQLISRFTWESNPVTTAVYGPNALSVSSFATVSAGGTNSSKGLNPGNGQNDVNLVLDGSYFNVPALDISVDFRKAESVASFFNRGTYFNFGLTNGSIAANFLLTSGVTFTAVNSGAVYTVPDDHAFHNYHFIYDNNTGVARILVDGAVVYTYRGITGVPLYWTGAGNVTIGKDMDATGKNVAILDNLIIQQNSSALLPVTLLSFAAEAKSKFAVLSFATTREVNITGFTIERSLNGTSFAVLTSIAADNGYNTINHYQFTDSILFSQVAYYRIKMINGDGSFTYSDVKIVGNNAANRTEVTVYPNPATDFVIIKMSNAAAGKYLYAVTAVSGQALSSSTFQLNNGAQQIKIDLSKTALHGIMLIKISNMQTGTTEIFTIVKK